MDRRILGMVWPFGAVAAVVVALVLIVVGLFWPLAVVAGLAVGAGVAWWLSTRGDSTALAGLRVREVGEDDEPRLHNILDGLCDSHGFRTPRVVVVDDVAANACAFGRDPEGGTLAVTRGLLDLLDRMQLEGVVARELAVLDDPARPAATVAAGLRSLLPRSMGDALVRKVTGPERAVQDDLEAVRLTRYPPGLASALAAVGGVPTAVHGVNRAGAHLWAVDPTAPAGGDTDGWVLDARVDALREL